MIESVRFRSHIPRSSRCPADGLWRVSSGRGRRCRQTTELRVRLRLKRRAEWNRIRLRHEFLDRLVPCLTKLPVGYKIAIEIRNRNWLDAEFANLLRDRRIALVLQDRSWMPNPAELKFDPITAHWTYIRWLGDRKAIEQQTMTWDKTVVDRSAELSSWVDFCYQVMKRGVLIYAFANNHFSGHSPATIEQFRSIWQSKGFPPLDAPQPSHRQPSLFSA